MADQVGDNYVETAMAAGTALANYKSISNTPVAIVPKGYEIRTLEHLLAMPARKRAKVDLLTVTSFVDYVNQQKTDNTRLYFSYPHASDAPGMFMAIIDDHGADPGWRQHVAFCTMRFSRKFVLWREAQSMRAQDEFVRLLERNVRDIADPDGASLMELCRNLEISKNASFSAMPRTRHDAVSFSYSETNTVKGAIEVPKSITLAIPVLERGPAVAIEAEFAYRLRESKLTFGFEIVRLQDILDAEVDRAIGAIEQATGITVWHGSTNPKE